MSLARSAIDQNIKDLHLRRNNHLCFLSPAAANLQSPARWLFMFVETSCAKNTLVIERRKMRRLKRGTYARRDQSTSRDDHR